MLYQLLDELDRYLIGELFLEDLERWLLSHLQDILDSKDELAIRIANEVDTDLMAMSEGLMDEEALREHAQALVNEARTIHVRVGAEPSIVDTLLNAGTSETVRSRMKITPMEEVRLFHRFA